MGCKRINQKLRDFLCDYAQKICTILSELQTVSSCIIVLHGAAFVCNLLNSGTWCYRHFLLVAYILLHAYDTTWWYVVVHGATFCRGANSLHYAEALDAVCWYEELLEAIRCIIDSDETCNSVLQSATRIFIEFNLLIGISNIVTCHAKYFCK